MQTTSQAVETDCMGDKGNGSSSISKESCRGGRSMVVADEPVKEQVTTVRKVAAHKPNGAVIDLALMAITSGDCSYIP